MPLRTPLYDNHLAAQAKIVDFGGWDMPLHYGSQIKEHELVRTDAGMFDVSHMTVIDVSGDAATTFLQHLLANDVAKLGFVGKALYSGMLNHEGGVIDDLIAYRTEHGYRLVVNAATRAKDWAWIQTVAEGFSVTLALREDLAMLAVQGPNAIAKVCSQLTLEQASIVRELKVFQGLPVPAMIAGDEDWFVGRTGYTGEDGLEIILPASAISSLWNALIQAGVAPCGLGARDTLRLEAGMNLYGHEMDESVSPLAANMAWTVALDDNRDFIGKARLLATANTEQLVGLVLIGKGVLRAGQRVIVEGVGEGIVTSGTFSPTMKQSIAMARIPLTNTRSATVDIRGKEEIVSIVRLPFVKHGKILTHQSPL